VIPEPFQNALILTGPTASGKSALALELASQLGAEIISMDSMTLYRGMDIGTAKPSSEDQSAIPHHLIDKLDPWESANVAWWLDRAAECCREIESRGKQTLFVGGTPFYLKAILHGLFPSPPANQPLRQQLEQEALEKGNEFLHSRLAQVDPIAGNKLHPNDVRRVVRALEVYELTGKPLSSWQTQNWFSDSSKVSVSFQESGIPRCVVIDVPREELYTRINSRVEKMIEDGWIDEVKCLQNLPHPISREAAQALGYRELFAYLKGEGGLKETIELIQTRTRQFAKRQLTWFRQLPNCYICSSKLTFDVWRGKIRNGGN
jgi:tRNA dimethylallyltransferase